MEANLVRRTFMALIFVVLPLATVLVTAQARSAGSTAASIEPASLDRSVDACTDFYQFACGGWVAAHPLPADRQRLGRFADLLERNFTILRRILAPSASPGAGAPASGAAP